jgi:hypothetical protein
MEWHFLTTIIATIDFAIACNEMQPPAPFVFSSWTPAPLVGCPIQLHQNALPSHGLAVHGWPSMGNSEFSRILRKFAAQSAISKPYIDMRMSKLCRVRYAAPWTEYFCVPKQENCPSDHPL